MYYPRPSGKKWAVLYGTWCGSSRDAALWIAEGLEGIADVFDIRERPDLKDYDHLVLGSSIRNYRIHPLFNAYIKENRTWLKDKVRGVWAVCHNLGKPVGPKQVERYIDGQFLKVLDLPRLPYRVFLGRITKALLEDEVRPLMEHLEDCDYLKRSDCLAFGREILYSIR
jgi:menaquinone-dependent protoporphyrinogen IX oxidase